MKVFLAGCVLPVNEEKQITNSHENITEDLTCIRNNVIPCKCCDWSEQFSNRQLKEVGNSGDDKG